MRDYSNQKAEIETIRERSIAIKLSDADTVRITEKAEGVGLTVAELLESFIGDLVSGTYSNGSDERMYADEWFNRCGFSWMYEKTFLTFLIRWGNIQPILDTLDYIAECEEDLKEATDEEERKAIEEELEYQRREIEDYYREYTDSYREEENGKEPQPYTEALEGVRAYKDRLEAFKKGCEHEASGQGKRNQKEEHRSQTEERSGEEGA